jgi:hypothetical protein
MKSKILILGIMLLILIIVSISGCTNISNEELFMNYTIEPKVVEGTDIGSTKIITLPENTQSIRVEYTNLSLVSNPLGSEMVNGMLDVYYLNTVLAEGQSVSNYPDNILGDKLVYLDNMEQVLSGNLTINDPNTKSLVISTNNIKGSLKIYITS